MPSGMFNSVKRSLWAALLSMLACAQVADAEPISEPWATQSSSPVTAVAAAELSGWYAVSETADDTVEIRDVRQELIRRITRQEILALVPWMTLDAGADGPRALAWTDSGRSLFIVVTDDAPSPDGLGSDAVLRYDTTTHELSRFTRAQIGDGTGPGPAAMHFKGRLWVSTQTEGIRVYGAQRNDITGSLVYSWSLPNAEPALGFGLARSLDLAFVVSDTMLYRVDLTQPFAVAEAIGPVTRGRGVAYSDHYGAPWQEGAYVAQGGTNGLDASVLQVPRFQATGLLPYAPNLYMQPAGTPHAIAATACGRLLLATLEGARVVRDSDDPRLDYESWLRDEFGQVVAFARGLVAPDGEPAGWVIDADARAGGARFHPASPDAAAWVVMLQITNDHLNGDQGSAPIVRDILQRYAGLMPDSIAPDVSADGIMHHWYDPSTGHAKPGWDPEYATLSTMLLVTAADRARRFYRGDAQIVQSANEIIGRVRQWDSYIQPGTGSMYFRALETGGPVFSSASAPFNEGVMFIEQARVYGSGDAPLAVWLDRSDLPQAQYVAGLPVTTNWPGNHLPAFVSLYPWLAQSSLRSDQSWRTHMGNLLASNGAWADDHGPRFMTVFSAGTTHPDWGGYHADSLSDHPGDVTTFPSLMGFSSLGITAPSVGAYRAYRQGAREQFASGASILFRRSQIDPGYTPSDAGLSDVAVGALGLAELIRPGTGEAVLAVAFEPPCRADLAPPRGVLNFFDISALLGAYTARDSAADLARPFGEYDFFDISAYLSAFSAGCP